MTTSVDVLAVMDDAAEVLLDERMGSTASRLECARAAVAELIEAIGPALYELRDKSEAKRDLIAALSRVKGA